MSEYYKLIGKDAVRCSAEDYLKWRQESKHEDRVVKKTQLNNFVGGGVEISTVFLGLDHAFFSNQPDIFETMIFGGEYDQFLFGRASTWKQAEKMHQQAIESIEATIKEQIDVDKNRQLTNLLHARNFLVQNSGDKYLVECRSGHEKCALESDPNLFCVEDLKLAAPQIEVHTPNHFA